MESIYIIIMIIISCSWHFILFIFSDIKRETFIINLNVSLATLVMYFETVSLFFEAVVCVILICRHFVCVIASRGLLSSFHVFCKCFYEMFFRFAMLVLHMDGL